MISGLMETSWTHESNRLHRSEEKPELDLFIENEVDHFNHTAHIQWLYMAKYTYFNTYFFPESYMNHFFRGSSVVSMFFQVVKC